MEDYMTTFDSIITAATLAGYKISYLNNQNTRVRIYDFKDDQNSLKITMWLLFNKESFLYKVITENHALNEQLEETTPSKYNDLFKEVLTWI